MFSHTQSPSQLWLVGMDMPAVTKKSRRNLARFAGVASVVAVTLYATFVVGFTSYQYFANGMDIRHAAIYAVTGEMPDKTSLKGLY